MDFIPVGWCSPPLGGLGGKGGGPTFSRQCADFREADNVRSPLCACVHPTPKDTSLARSNVFDALRARLAVLAPRARLHGPFHCMPGACAPGVSGPVNAWESSLFCHVGHGVCKES